MRGHALGEGVVGAEEGFGVGEEGGVFLIEGVSCGCGCGCGDGGWW